MLLLFLTGVGFIKGRGNGKKPSANSTTNHDASEHLSRRLIELGYGIVYPHKNRPDVNDVKVLDTVSRTNRELMSRCDGVIVSKHWKKLENIHAVQEECECAEGLRIPIFYADNSEHMKILTQWARGSYNIDDYVRKQITSKLDKKLSTLLKANTEAERVRS